ncbi:MAG: hypothetical protein ACOYNY_27520 [Caldilineaceae bacterium]
MKLYIQSRSLDSDFTWIEVTSEAVHELLADPHANYETLMKYIDSGSPSILIARTSDDEIIVLAKKLPSQRRLRSGEPIRNSILAVFTIEESFKVGTFVSFIMGNDAINDSESQDIFNPLACQEINNCIVNGTDSKKFDVSRDLFQVVQRIIEHSTVIAPKVAEKNKDNRWETQVARNSKIRRSELAEELLRNSWSDSKSLQPIIPIIVVTGKQDVESLIAAGATRILTDLVPNEEWKIVEPDGLLNSRPNSKRTHQHDKPLEPDHKLIDESNQTLIFSSFVDAFSSKLQEKKVKVAKSIWTKLKKWGQNTETSADDGKS